MGLLPLCPKFLLSYRYFQSRLVLLTLYHVINPIRFFQQVLYRGMNSKLEVGDVMFFGIMEISHLEVHLFHDLVPSLAIIVVATSFLAASMCLGPGTK